MQMGVKLLLVGDAAGFAEPQRPVKRRAERDFQHGGVLHAADVIPLPEGIQHLQRWPHFGKLALFGNQLRQLFQHLLAKGGEPRQRRLIEAGGEAFDAKGGENIPFQPPSRGIREGGAVAGGFNQDGMLFHGAKHSPALFAIAGKGYRAAGSLLEPGDLKNGQPV